MNLFTIVLNVSYCELVGGVVLFGTFYKSCTLKSNKNYKNAQKYFEDGACSGLLSFELESFEDATKVVNATKLYSLVVNIGDSKSIITHPASTTHQQLSPEELNACGVPAGLIRISCGLESANDLIEDMKLSLEEL